MTDEVQTTLEFFDENAPQPFYCKKCGEFHKIGECKEVKKDERRPSEEGG